MANLKTESSGRSYMHWNDPDATHRSYAVGLQDEETLGHMRFLWDKAVAVTQAKQGRKKGRPLPRPEEPDHIDVDSAIEGYLKALDASSAAPSTKANTRSQLNKLREALGPRWEGWMAGYWKHLDGIKEPNTRKCRKRAANHLVDHHLGAIPDFTRKTRVNRPANTYVSERGRPRQAASKTYNHEEGGALLSHIHILPEFMQLQEWTGALMGMSPEDARNFLRCRTPLGAETTTYDWEACTYFARRQKTATYFEHVPIPRRLVAMLLPHAQGESLALPFEFPSQPETYRDLHRELEEAAGVERIKRRNLNAWRHHFSTTLEVDLRTPRVVVKSLMAQKTKRGERQDVIDVYQHAWPALMLDASKRYEDLIAELIQSDAAGRP